MTLLVCTLRAENLEVGEVIECDCWEESYERAFDLVMKLYEFYNNDMSGNTQIQEEIREDIMTHNQHTLYQACPNNEEYDDSKAVKVVIIGASDT